jgi:hypothetical protein
MEHADIVPEVRVCFVPPNLRAGRQRQWRKSASAFGYPLDGQWVHVFIAFPFEQMNVIGLVQT